MATIPRKPPTGSLAEWERSKPTLRMAHGHMARVVASAPAGWQAVVRERLAVGALSPIKSLDASNLTAEQ